MDARRGGEDFEEHEAMSEPIIKWKTGGYGKSPIERVECIKETAKFVWPVGEGRFEPRQTAKRSEWDNYFESWQEAHRFLCDRASAEVQSKRDALTNAEEKLAGLMKLEPPTP